MDSDQKVQDLCTIVATASRSEGQVIETRLHEHGDRALAFVEEHDAVSFTPQEEKKLLRKIDRVLMPLMITSYMMQYMDKSVMSQAAVYDLIPSLGLHGQQYSWCSSSFYFGYLCFQPLGSRLLARVPLGRFVAIVSVIWAIILFSTAGVYNFRGMMVARFMLGVAEGGISPAFVLLTSFWYRRHEIPLRVSFWVCGNGLASIFQAFIAYGIGHIRTGIAIWRWFFIIFGIVSLIWAAVLWVWMPDSPLSAKFLNERERAIAIERLRENRTGVANPKFKKEQAVEALTDPKVWYGFLYLLGGVITGSAVANFGGLIIKGFGFGDLQTSLLNCPLGFMEIVFLLATGALVLYFPNSRCLMQFISMVPAVIGCVFVYTLPSEQRVRRLIAFYFAESANAGLALQFALTATNIAGHTKRAIANSILFIGYSVGFIVGPQFFLTREAPRYQTGFKTMVVTYSILCAAPVLYWSYVTYLNRQKSRKLRDLGGDGAQMMENEEFLDLSDKEQLRFVYAR